MTSKPHDPLQPLHSHPSAISSVISIRASMMTLAAVSTFFISWGEGLSILASIDTSRVFVVLAAFLAAGMAVLTRVDHLPYSTLLRYWLAYMLLHTLVVYFIWKPDQLQWGILGARQLAGGATKVSEGTGLRVARFFLLAAYGGALSVLIDSSHARRLIMLSYVLGLNCVIMLGGYQLTADPTTVARLAGGSLDPNAFGLSCATGIAACLYLLNERPARPVFRLCTIALTPGLVIALLASGSRGAMLGMIAGLLVTLLCGRSRSRLVIMLTIGATIVAASYLLLPADIKTAAQDRFSMTSIVSDRGSSRPELWRSYIKELPNYAVWGTGMHLGPTAISSSWDTPRMTHNVYLQLLVENGAFALLLFTLGVAAIYRRLLQSRNPNDVALAGMLATWLVASFFLDSFNIRESWLILAMACSTVRLEKELPTWRQS